MNYSSIYDGVFSDSFMRFVKTVDSPLSLKYKILFENGEFDQLLASRMPDPSDYSCSLSFKADYQVWNLLRKANFIPTSVDLEAVALSKFYDSERECKLTNNRLKLINDDFVAHTFFMKVRGKIADALGPFDVSRLPSSGGFGPGATSTLPRKRSTLSDKVLSEMSATAGAVPYINYMLREDYHLHAARGYPIDGPVSFLRETFNIVKGCNGQFVPKDARSHRFIAIEPTWNMYVQKAIGSLIKEKLRYVRTRSDSLGIQYSLPNGIDITAAQDRHGEIIHNRELFDSIATVDLSSASDSVSRELVSLLMPDDWFQIMDAVRSKWVTLPNGEDIFLQKFSSMGNGFTFELETLIFWAISSSVSELSYVYGDDIIILGKDFETLRKWLEYAGFKLNCEKSFCSGPFRETCGYHSFLGDDVKPVYVKDYPLRDAYTYFDFINRLRVGLDKGVVHPAMSDVYRRLRKEWNGLHLSLLSDDPLPVGVALPFDHPLISLRGRQDKRGYDGLKLPGLRPVTRESNLPWDEVGLWFRLKNPVSNEPRTPTSPNSVKVILGYSNSMLYHRYSVLS